jgi:hypothetical protein
LGMLGGEPSLQSPKPCNNLGYRYFVTVTIWKDRCMPASLALGKPLTGAVLMRLAAEGMIRGVVDVGPGCGVYSRLFRSLLGDVPWTAIEVWAPYVRQYILNDLYDRIVIGDIRYLDIKKVGEDGVFLFGDVLEHMTIDDAVEVVENASHHARLMVLSVPIGCWPQGEVDGNVFETHVEENLSNQDITDNFPNLCAARTFLDSRGRGVSVFFAAAEEADREKIARFVDEEERAMVDTIGSGVLQQAFVDFGNDRACAEFQDQIVACLQRSDGVN